MEKRYQVFISSTFMDLKDERQTALKAVLELDHMPAGMELFPAVDDTAWQLIKDVIDASDYYVVIIGGRYGSVDEEGIGYTEKEYEYAISTKKPVIALLHEKPDKLPREKTETDGEVWKKLLAFRSKIEKRHTCVYWNNAEQLKAKLIIGLTAETKRCPAVGWIRANQVPSQTTLADILSLRNRIAELENQLRHERTAPPTGIEDLLQGDEEFPIKCSFRSSGSVNKPRESVGWTGTLEPSWNEIFAGVAPLLIQEASDSRLRRQFVTLLERLGKDAWAKDKDFKGFTLSNFEFADEEQITTCIIQLRALGLIQESQKKRSIHDKGIYWTLTPFGDQQMVQLRALRRTLPSTPKVGEKKST
ncbi:MAG: hypothetical protein A2270_08720 [Elusimicrobia bacterium RIFOXYA12_FULL_51_18]|nr:MAG: hypothetical protein A2270_08720 [Elusimicrobia bacterium RIFOXYA12_FULL_51_18]OGS31480.1 MAG: hypothetical protein A2218_09460 [Elusimicrobia bacterium RIFOXYA2_FULL_53_38]